MGRSDCKMEALGEKQYEIGCGTEQGKKYNVCKARKLKACAQR